MHFILTMVVECEEDTRKVFQLYHSGEVCRSISVRMQYYVLYDPSRG
jgi:hypothetical protein